MALVERGSILEAGLYLAFIKEKEKERKRKGAYVYL